MNPSPIFSSSGGAGDGGQFRHSHRRFAGDEDDQCSPIPAQRHCVDHRNNGLRGADAELVRGLLRRRSSEQSQLRTESITIPITKVSRGVSTITARLKLTTTQIKAVVGHQLESGCDPARSATGSRIPVIAIQRLIRSLLRLTSALLLIYSAERSDDYLVRLVPTASHLRRPACKKPNSWRLRTLAMRVWMKPASDGGV